MASLVLLEQQGHTGWFLRTPTLRSGGLKLSKTVRQMRLFIFHVRSIRYIDRLHPLWIMPQTIDKPNENWVCL